ncbi:UNVERIFIED_CONTAM: hypothetical protein HDU68_002903 [Siphonaria sp. JEL0065]|nr:hypothetical protein HDU68_002903 [Siphonaria sp. JEL0065]
MASPILVASTYYLDSQCAKPIRISYSRVNSTDCTAASIADSTTCTETTAAGWWLIKQCVASNNVASVGSKVFGSDVPQVLSSYADKGCPAASQPFVSGDLWPLDKCIRSFPKASYSSFRTLLDPNNGTIYWTSFSDTKCSTLTDYWQYGSSTQSNQCVSDFDASVTLLNYQNMVVYTTYSGSDCRSPSKVSSTPSYHKCESSSKCVQSSGDAEYYSYNCSVTDTSATVAASLFPAGQYFTYYNYLDSNCALPWEIDYVLLGLCTTSSHYSGASVNSSLSADGSLVTVTYYSNPGCLGSVVKANLFSTDGACTSAGKILFQKPYSNSTGGDGGGESKTNIGVIAGGAIGGIVVLGAIIVTAVFYAKKQQKAAPITERTGVVDTLVVPPYSQSNANSPVIPFVKSDAVNPKDIVSNVSKTAIAQPTAVSVDEPVFLVTTSSASALPEKLKSGLFDGMTSNTVPTSLNKAAEAQSSTSGPSTEKEYAMFGDLCLPALPSQWSIDEVVEWVSKNEGTAEVLRFIKDQEIDGRALLFMNLDALQFQTVGRRVRFEESLIALRNMNNAKLASLEENIAPPSYS